VIKGFRSFILRGNVVDLAVGIVIGAAFGAVVSALVKDLITPIIGAIGGKPDFSTLSFTINKSRFLYGDFINAIISFLLIAAAVYFFVVVPLNRLMAKYKPSAEEPTPTKECPHCLSSIPAAASRCAFCTADLGEQLGAGAAVPVP
jgi:large conductance mechanosensitive channel